MTLPTGSPAIRIVKALVLIRRELEEAIAHEQQALESVVQLGKTIKRLSATWLVSPGEQSEPQEATLSLATPLSPSGERLEKEAQDLVSDMVHADLQCSLIREKGDENGCHYDESTGQTVFCSGHRNHYRTGNKLRDAIRALASVKRAGGHAKNCEAVHILQEILGCVERQELIRNIEADSEPGWALRAAPLVSALAKAQKMVDEARCAALEQPSCPNCVRNAAEVMRLQGELAESRRSGPLPSEE